MQNQLASEDKRNHPTKNILNIHLHEVGTMWNLIIFLTIFGSVLGFTTEDGLTHYNRYQVIRVIPETYSQLEGLLTLAKSGKYDFWQDPRPGGSADVMVSPSTYQELVDKLDHYGIKYFVMISDVEELIHEERVARKSRQLAPGDMDWTSYHSWEDIDLWLSKLAAENDIITEEVYGTSYENRTLKLYKVSTGGTNKPAVWIDATIHAREHISTAVLTYIINQLATNTSSYEDILDKVDFYLVPFINPDGYNYSYVQVRLWRWTRSHWDPTQPCMGVDANRNFGFHFAEEGSSNDPCTEIYHGPNAYSEPETEAVRRYILDKAENENVNWQGFITLHSYSQLWMTPYGYTEEVPEDYEELKRVADAATKELYSYYKTSYEVGNAGSVLYLSSGSSRDWAKGEVGIKYVYTLELRDTGRYGFLLPPSLVIPTSIETWAGIQVVAREIGQQ